MDHELQTVADIGRLTHLQVVPLPLFRFEEDIRILHHVKGHGLRRTALDLDAQRIGPTLAQEYPALFQGRPVPEYTAARISGLVDAGYRFGNIGIAIPLADRFPIEALQEFRVVTEIIPNPGQGRLHDLIRASADDGGFIQGNGSGCEVFPKRPPDGMYGTPDGRRPLPGKDCRT